MRTVVVRVVQIALVVTLVGATFVSSEAASRNPGRLFASASTGPFNDNVRVDPGTAENAGNEIGRFWQSSNSYLGNNFNGECPSNNGEMSWWGSNVSGRRRIEGVLSGVGTDGSLCDPVRCPIGDMTLVVEEMSADGEDALFIGFRVDERPPENRWWDYSRVDPSPSPSVLQMLSFPSADVVSSSGLPNGNIQLDLLLEDVAPNVHAVNGPDDAPLPASSIVSSYDLYIYEGQGIPGRDVASWTLIEQVAYQDGPVSVSLEVACGNDTLIAVGLSFDGSTGPDVVSSYVGRANQVECTQNPVNADAGEVTLIASWIPYLDTDTVQVTIRDETEPFLSCGLTVAGGDDEGDDSLRFAISLIAEDLCCADVATSAKVDLGWARLPVVDGQVIGLRCTGSDDDEDDDCGKVGNCGERLKIRSSEATLRGVATDCNGNTATCELDLCEPPSSGSHSTPESTTRRENGRMEFGSSGN